MPRGIRQLACPRDRISKGAQRIQRRLPNQVGEPQEDRIRLRHECVEGEQPDGQGDGRRYAYERNRNPLSAVRVPPRT